MDMSVIVPTRNRAALLGRMLDGLRRQSCSSDIAYEVIVVDNGSSDATPQVIRDAAPYFPHFAGITEAVPGLHAARHAGLRRSSGEILVYCDDDIVPNPTWLQGIADSFLIRKIGIVTGPCLPDYEITPPDWIEKRQVPIEDGWLNYAYSLLHLGELPRPIPHYGAFGCNFSVRRDVLVAAGGFQPDAMPPELREYRGNGETGLAEAIEANGFRTFYNPDVAVRHWVSADRMTPEYIYVRGFADGISQSFRLTRWAGKLVPFPEHAESRTRIPHLDSCGDPIAVQADRGSIDGYWFHQRRLRENPRLLPWVLRPTYLDHEAIESEGHP